MRSLNSHLFPASNRICIYQMQMCDYMCYASLNIRFSFIKHPFSPSIPILIKCVILSVPGLFLYKYIQIMI